MRQYERFYDVKARLIRGQLAASLGVRYSRTHLFGADESEGWLARGPDSCLPFGPCGPNVQNNCPELMELRRIRSSVKNGRKSRWQSGGWGAPAVQMPNEVSPLYRWVSPDVLGAPSVLNQAYLDE
ncbi:hypothetical protein PIB30_017233 [Stylosanthes scabra]|uniref:Uncharacterized protein n=1 Tax=Stylosanthes scabra TaxID=79078 RepID=A0ABU6Z641_9FABA|nr:hypothetical protein [Stylosanthes scabra]